MLVFVLFLDVSSLFLQSLTLIKSAKHQADSRKAAEGEEDIGRLAVVISTFSRKD